MLKELKLKYGLDFLENVPLSDYTSFKVGGPAKYFLEVSNKADLRKALQAVVDKKLDYLIIGNGSNILVSDDGFDGLVIRLVNGVFQKVGLDVFVFGGFHWPKFVQAMVNQKLEGLEFSGNIPGSVGGCVRGNAGAYGKGIGDFVREVEVLVVGEKEVTLKKLTGEECKFGYRDSIFKKKPNWVIAEASFVLEEEITPSQERMKEIIEEGAVRCAKQPLTVSSAGCSFKNVIYTDALSKYKDWEIKGKLPAAKFIDGAGLKGTKIGGAMISKEHANFIVNMGEARATDIEELYKLVKERVQEKYGVDLEEEVQYVGSF